MAELNGTTLLSDANLEAYFRFNSGALTTDSSGDGETLTNNNTVGETASGKYGYAADFGATNTNKNFTRLSNLGITNNSLSISLWVKLGAEISSGTWEFALHESTTTAVAYLLLYDYNAGTRRVTLTRFREGTGTDVSSTYNITLGTTDWHHIVGTCDGTTQRLYVNGTLRDSDAIGANGVGGSNIIRLGGSAGFGWASTYMDDVAYFSDALSADEVTSLYTDAAAGTSNNLLLLGVG